MRTTDLAGTPQFEEWRAILALLDDATPEVAAYVSKRLALTDGDASEVIAALPGELSQANCKRLSVLLRPARRTKLEQEWQVPRGGAMGFADDWDTFESLVRLVSDFQHDGISLRQPLSDALDLWAEEAIAAGADRPYELFAWLLHEERLRTGMDGWETTALDPAKALAGEETVVTTMAIVVCLIAVRLEIAFDLFARGTTILFRFCQGGDEWLVDLGKNFRPVSFESLSEEEEEPEEDLDAVSLTPGDLLLRHLRDLCQSLACEERMADLRLIKRLIRSLRN